jgi:hypothetical protein
MTDIEYSGEKKPCLGKLSTGCSMKTTEKLVKDLIKQNNDYKEMINSLKCQTPCNIDQKTNNKINQLKNNIKLLEFQMLCGQNNPILPIQQGSVVTSSSSSSEIEELKEQKKALKKKLKKKEDELEKVVSEKKELEKALEISSSNEQKLVDMTNLSNLQAQKLAECQAQLDKLENLSDEEPEEEPEEELNLWGDEFNNISDAPPPIAVPDQSEELKAKDAKIAELEKEIASLKQQLLNCSDLSGYISLADHEKAITETKKLFENMNDDEVKAEFDETIKENKELREQLVKLQALSLDVEQVAKDIISPSNEQPLNAEPKIEEVLSVKEIQDLVVSPNFPLTDQTQLTKDKYQAEFSAKIQQTAATLQDYFDLVFKPFSFVPKTKISNFLKAQEFIKDHKDQVVDSQSYWTEFRKFMAQVGNALVKYYRAIQFEIDGINDNSKSAQIILGFNQSFCFNNDTIGKLKNRKDLKSFLNISQSDVDKYSNLLSDIVNYAKGNTGKPYFPNDLSKADAFQLEVCSKPGENHAKELGAPEIDIQIPTRTGW